jgi:hypothetical protein
MVHNSEALPSRFKPIHASIFNSDSGSAYTANTTVTAAQVILVLNSPRSAIYCTYTSLVP